MDGWREGDDDDFSKGELLAEMNSAGHRERLIGVEALKDGRAYDRKRGSCMKRRRDRVPLESC